MRRSRKLMAAVTAVVLSLAMAMPAFAASKISSISLEITSYIYVGDTDGEVEVDTSSSKYSVSDVSITNTPSDEWEDGDKPKIKVTLEAEDDYTFASGLTKSDVEIDGNDGSVTSVKRSSSTKFLVYITLEALDDDDDDDDSDYELDIDSTWWDESDGYAYWEEPDDAKKYEVKLYRGSTVLTTVTTTKEYYNFASYFTQSGTYKFKVRAVYNSSNKGSWETSDSWSVTSSEATEIRNNNSSSSSSSSSSSDGPGSSSSTGSGAWLKDDYGWWYCYSDKSYPVSQWSYIDGYWYYFNESGYMATGWVYWNNLWYYCSSSGAMMTSGYTPDGYYVGADGAWVQ